ncbi:unnamed protein product, partial [Chrysoparadoxa australica]
MLATTCSLYLLLALIPLSLLQGAKLAYQPGGTAQRSHACSGSLAAVALRGGQGGWSDEEEDEGYSREEDEWVEEDIWDEDGSPFERTDLYGSSRGSLGKVAVAGAGVVKGAGKLTIKSMKGVVHVLQPRQVELQDILTAWKLEQEIVRDGREERSAATIELRRDGTVVTRYEGREVVTDFIFKRHSWPRACTIEFEARAFQGPDDPVPLLKHYKGQFTRNLMDSKIIGMEGSIYDVEGRGLWRRKSKTGSFTGTRRPLMSKQKGRRETRRPGRS